MMKSPTDKSPTAKVLTQTPIMAIDAKSTPVKGKEESSKDTAKDDMKEEWSPCFLKNHKRSSSPSSSSSIPSSSAPRPGPDQNKCVMFG
jgi:hypothetical protein